MKLLINLLMIPVTVTVTGFALKDLWFWFIVPLGVLEIGFAHALGLSVVISAMTMQIFEASQDEDLTWMINTFGGTIKWLFAWGTGGVISLFLQ